MKTGPIASTEYTRRQAIITRRTENGYSATSQGARVRVPIDYSVNSEERHLQAAVKLITKLDWAANGTWHGAYLPDCNSMAWVCVERIE